MKPAMEELDLEHELVQLLVREAVRAAMTTPLREPILEGAEGALEEPTAASDDVLEGETAGEESTETEPETSGTGALARTARSLTVLLVLVAVLYVAFRRFAGEK